MKILTSKLTVYNIEYLGGIKFSMREKPIGVIMLSLYMERFPGDLTTLGKVIGNIATLIGLILTATK